MFRTHLLTQLLKNKIRKKSTTWNLLKRPPSDIGKDPDEVNTLNFLSQRKKKRLGNERGRERKISEKQSFTELRNSPEI